MANLPASSLFGTPDERLETATVLKKTGLTKNGLANKLELHRSTVGRWRKWVPKVHHEKIRPLIK